MGPTHRPAADVWYASLTWPRICGSPTTRESRPAATRNRCATAALFSSANRWGWNVGADTWWYSLIKETSSSRACAGSVVATYSSERLHVDRTTASLIDGRAAIAPAAALRSRLEKSSRSRRSTGAVRWLTPSRNRCTSVEGMARRHEIIDREKIHHGEGETDRRQPRGTPAGPAESPRNDRK